MANQFNEMNMGDAYLMRMTSFYYKVQDLMGSKRFSRFVEYVRKTSEELFREMFPGTPSMTLEKFFHRAIQGYLTHDENEDQVSAIGSSAMIRSTPYDIVSACTCGFSTLWAYGKEVESRSDEFGSLKENIIDDSIRTVIDTDRYPKLLQNALNRACYDFIQLQAVNDDSIEDENWLPKVRESLSCGWLIYILTKTFEYVLQNVENTAAFGLLHIDPNIGLFSPFTEMDEIKKTLTATEELHQQEIEHLRGLLSSEKEARQALQKENASLKQTVETRDNADNENKKLRKELKDAAAENQKLSEKYQSLLEYAEKLSEDVSEEPEEEEMVSPEIFTKRVVFVRDKENEGYVMMRKLEEMFPNAKFTNGIASDINAKTTDIIVALISYTCHGTYWGASGIAKKNGIPFLAIKNKNVNVIAAGIQKTLKENV